MNNTNNKPSSAYKLYPTSVGIEYALVPEGLNYNRDWNLLDPLLIKTVGLVNRRFSKFPSWKKFIFDAEGGGKMELGAIEFSSVPLNTQSQVAAFYKYATKLFDFAQTQSGYKFVANTVSDEVYVEGGGGHIHLGTKIAAHQHEFEHICFRRNLAIFMLNNPIVQWFMAEWCDDDILTSTYYNAFQKEMRCKISSFSTELIAPHLELYASGWGRGPTQVRTNGSSEYKSDKFDTIEFRCLAAPTSYQHLLDNIDLCCKIWELVKRTSYSSLYKLKFSSVRDIIDYHNDISDPLIEFKHLLINLGLDPKRYEKYLANYQMREAHGHFYGKTFAGIE